MNRTLKSAGVGRPMAISIIDEFSNFIHVGWMSEENCFNGCYRSILGMRFDNSLKLFEQKKCIQKEKFCWDKNIWMKLSKLLKGFLEVSEFRRTFSSVAFIILNLQIY